MIRHRSMPRVLGLCLAVLLFAFIPAGSATSAGTTESPRAKQERIRREKAETAGQLDTVKATAKELGDALAVIDDNLRQEEAALESAQRTVDEETAAAEALGVQVEQARAELASLEQLLVESVVAEYVRPPFSNDLLTSSGDINEAIRKQALFAQANRSNEDATNAADNQRAELETLEAAQVEAAARAAAARDEVAGRFSVVEVARADQAELVNAADARVDHIVSELANLDAQDKAVTAEIEAEARRLAEIAERNARKNATRTYTAPAGITLKTVNGIQVNATIADQLQRMLNAAEAAGISLGGTGYRDSSRQIELRRQNCGPSNYDIYQKNPFSCRPATARPGTSNHEQGLAIDFTLNGSTLRRGTTAFQWLSRNAASYGFYNLPSESWHWSADGR